MARAAVQVHITTEEDFQSFIDRPGLLVMDVYSEWSGPCEAMEEVLRKLKLGKGGDILQLATINADTIETFKRFRGLSEPTWLFASNGKAFHIMYGSNAPKLIDMITKEMENEKSGKSREYYEFSEHLPKERRKKSKFKEMEAHLKEVETAEEEQRLQDHLTAVTHSIMTSLPDSGVTLFGPHITREEITKTIAMARKLNIAIQDRGVYTVSKNDLKILHYHCKNPLSNEVWKYMFGKELQCCLWKKMQNATQSIVELLEHYVEECSNPTPVLDEEGEVESNDGPPVLRTLEVKFRGSQEVIERKKDDDEVETADTALLGMLGAAMDDDVSSNLEELEIEEEEMEKENEHDEPHLEGDVEESDHDLTVLPIPPVWSPDNPVATAAGIYLLFKQLLGNAVPPEPEPTPPHLAIAFDVSKRRQVAQLCDQFGEDILAHGYFTTDDPATAQLITNSTIDYVAEKRDGTDKLIFKVRKKRSNAILSFASLDPTYISFDLVRGRMDCMKFFPEEYETLSCTNLRTQDDIEITMIPDTGQTTDQKSEDVKELIEGFDEEESFEGEIESEFMSMEYSVEENDFISVQQAENVELM